MKEFFDDPRSENKRLNASSMLLIEHATKIIKRLQAIGLTPSLRQLHYQLVTKNLIPNTKNDYKRLSAVLSRGRLMGLVDWDAIEDRVRRLKQFGNFDNPQQLFRTMTYYYEEDVRKDQSNYIEVRIEKDALEGVIARPCQRNRVPFLAMRGFNSQSEAYEGGKRIAEERDKGKKIFVLHFGDHDPSGKDMSRDEEERLRMFLRDDNFEFIRVALNMDQIKKYKPPPQFVNDKDCRAPGYRASHGSQVWELDALEPEVLDALVEKSIKELTDEALFEAAMEREQQHSDEIRQVGAFAADNWNECLSPQSKNQDEGDYAW